jgi:hypothetical protein
VALHKGHTYRVISIIRDRRRTEQWSGIRSTVRTAMRFRNWIFRPLLRPALIHGQEITRRRFIPVGGKASGPSQRIGLLSTRIPSWQRPLMCTREARIVFVQRYSRIVIFAPGSSVNPAPGFASRITLCSMRSCSVSCRLITQKTQANAHVMNKAVRNTYRNA